MMTLGCLQLMNVVMRSALCTYGNLTLTNEKQVTQLPVGPGVTICDKFLCGDVIELRATMLTEGACTPPNLD